jgi:hypothetical protein
MPVNPSVKICTHIKATGHTCASPALRGEAFCYFHQRMIRGVPTPPKSRIHPMALIENPEGIQVALMETINAIVRNTIDLKRANLLLRALSIAARNARHVRFDRCESEMVRKLPEPLPAAQPPAAAPEASPKPSPENQAQTASTQAWDQQWNQPKKDAGEPQPPRKPAGRVTSAATAQAPAKAVNAYPMRE